MVDFIEGELIAISVLIFLLGLLFQVYRFFSVNLEKGVVLSQSSR